MLELEEGSVCSYEETMSLLGVEPSSVIEEKNEPLKMDDNADKPSIVNYFLTKPQGIIIQDSWNNFAFPIRPAPHIDTKKFDLQTIFLRYREEYTAFDTNMLPWHYVVEMVGNRYYAFNTRPITMRYPLRHNEMMERETQLPWGVTWNDETKKFMSEKLFLIEEAIHVCICGDSSMDTYPKNFYKVLGAFCVRPFLHYFKLPHSSRTRTFNLNTGRKFNFDYMFKFLYR